MGIRIETGINKMRNINLQLSVIIDENYFGAICILSLQVSPRKTNFHRKSCISSRANL